MAFLHSAAQGELCQLHVAMRNSQNSLAALALAPRAFNTHKLKIVAELNVKRIRFALKFRENIFSPTSARHIRNRSKPFEII